MGDWVLIIRGRGAHHNSDFLGDADRMGKEFVVALKKQGHTITGAECYTSQVTDLNVVDRVTQDILNAPASGSNDAETR